MKIFKSLLITIMATLSFTACTGKNSAQTTSEQTDSINALVLYYSQTGATKAVAEDIANLLNADIEAIEAVEPYDGDFNATIERCNKEREANKNPDIKPIKSDLTKYDVVFVGFPVWFGTYAAPIATLVANNDFDGVKVVPFCTFGSGGTEACTTDLRKALPKADIKDGYGVRNARVKAAPAEIEYFLKANSYLPGEVQPLPAFSEQKPVDDATKAIFEAACSDYQFPLGTPVTAGQRKISTGTEYEFIAESKDFNGNTTKSTIYVVAPEAQGESPYFTSVVR